jgi:hypothetical protein
LASVAERSVQLSAHRCHGLGAWLGIPVRNVTYRRRPGAGTEMIAGLVSALGCARCCVTFGYLPCTWACLAGGGKPIKRRSLNDYARKTAG